MRRLEKYNKVMFDTGLSLKAKGLFTIIYDMNNCEVPVTVKTLECMTLDGEKSIRSGLKELIDFGYIEKVTIKNEKNQRFEGIIYSSTI